MITLNFQNPNLSAQKGEQLTEAFIRHFWILWERLPVAET